MMLNHLQSLRVILQKMEAKLPRDPRESEHIQVESDDSYHKLRSLFVGLVTEDVAAKYEPAKEATESIQEYHRRMIKWYKIKIRKIEQSKVALENDGKPRKESRVSVSQMD